MFYVKKAASFPVQNIIDWKNKMLNWANRFNIFCFLDNQQYHHAHPTFECLLAVDAMHVIECSAGNALSTVGTFSQAHNDWCFGHLSYDLKNEVEKGLLSEHIDGIGFTDTAFFIPATVVRLATDVIEIFSEADPKSIYEQIEKTSPHVIPHQSPAFDIQSRFSFNEYMHAVNEIKRHIQRGDCYEVNFCQEFYVEQATIHPLEVYVRLIQLSPNPFSALYRWNDKYCICASPERYLKKAGNVIISQPIKGTAQRNVNDPVADSANKMQLLLSEKEKSENVMVVDLVRNDLSKVCVDGSVYVKELFGIYSFPQVHQMISTVCGEVRATATIEEIFKATFPMGSMTGAPKKRVMELIEQYEKTKRGLFSGSIGYFTPEGDFDFNVVIRSVLYNATSKFLSFQTGSAITFYSDAEKEYHECLLKAKAIKAVLC